MDKINELINHQLPQSFGYEDDLVMEKLSRCIEKLANLKLDTIAEQVPSNELPQVPFGSFKPSSNLLLLQQSLAKKPADEQLRILADADHLKRKNLQQVKKSEGSLSDSDGLDDEDDDDDDSDIEPSNLSAYDDDKCDKESVISQMTMSSTSNKGVRIGGDKNGSVASSLENGRRTASGKSTNMAGEKPRANYSGSYLVSQVRFISFSLFVSNKLYNFK